MTSQNQTCGRLGFLGTGGIAEAMIIGLIEKSGYSDTISITRRSEPRSRRLSERFSNIQVFDSNEQLVKSSDSVMIAVLPHQAEQVLAELPFEPHQTIISLVAGLCLDDIKRLIAPAVTCCRLIPLPMTELTVGPIPLIPHLEHVEKLLAGIGQVIPIENEKHFSVLSASSAVMATYFETVASVAAWIRQKGLSETESVQYATNMFKGLNALTLEQDFHSLVELSEDCLTRGGLNEQVLRHFQSSGHFESLQQQLDLILDRVK